MSITISEIQDLVDAVPQEKLEDVVICLIARRAGEKLSFRSKEADILLSRVGPYKLIVSKLSTEEYEREKFVERTIEAVVKGNFRYMDRIITTILAQEAGLSYQPGRAILNTILESLIN